MTEAPIGLRRHWTVRDVPGEAVYLITENATKALRGDLLPGLLPLLDGTRGRSDVIREGALAIAAQGGPVAAARTARALAALERHGVVGPAVPAAEPRAAAYWDAALGDGDAALRRLATRSLRLVLLDEELTEEARAACATAGLTLAEHEADLTLVLCADYLDPRLTRIDAAHRTAGAPWLLAKPGGPVVWAGPVFRPGTACWHCVSYWLWHNRPGEAHVQRVLGLSGPVPKVPADTAATRAVGLGLAVHEAALWLAGAHEDGSDVPSKGVGRARIRTLDTVSLTGDAHSVRRRPQCPSCGDPEQAAADLAAPFRPRSRPKSPPSDGGHRFRSPDRMWRDHRDLVDPLTGIVHEVTRQGQGPEFLNSFRAGHNAALPAAGLAGLRAGLRNYSSGKGTTEEQARVGALCEALERHSGVLQGYEPRRRARLGDLGDTAVHPRTYQLFSDRQFAERERWNRAAAPQHRVPPPFDEDAVVDWSPVWSLTRGRRLYLPTSSLYYSAAPLDGLATAPADSNGCAAGSCLEDAVVQGFLELVERDAVALWWYNRVPRPSVELGSFRDPWLDALGDRHARMGRTTWVLDVTSDFGIPVAVAVSRRTDRPTQDVMLGFGAHFDPRIAVIRALTELHQLLPAVVDAREDGSGYAAADPDLLSWWRGTRVEEHPHLVPDPRQPARSRADYAYTYRPDLLDDIRAIERLVTERGMELLVHDQTRPDIKVPVVKVIVPGMRHFWPRLAPGRLFDVPVSLGWQATPTPYDELNPVPVFL